MPGQGSRVMPSTRHFGVLQCIVCSREESKWWTPISGTARRSTTFFTFLPRQNQGGEPAPTAEFLPHCEVVPSCQLYIDQLLQLSDRSIPVRIEQQYPNMAPHSSH